MMPSFSCLDKIKIDADFFSLFKDETFCLPSKDSQHSQSNLPLKDKIKVASFISVGTVSFHILLLTAFLWTAFHKADIETPVQIVEVNLMTLSSSEQQDEAPPPSISESVSIEHSDVSPASVPEAVSEPVQEPEPQSEPISEPIPEIKSEIPPLVPAPQPVPEKPKPEKNKKPVEVKKIKPLVQKPVPETKQPLIKQVNQPIVNTTPSVSSFSETSFPSSMVKQGSTLNEQASKNLSTEKSSGGITTGVKNVYNPRPSYPASARRRGDEGTVLVRLVIGKNGEITSVSLHKSSGFDSLDNAALSGVRSWRFSPALKNGEPVEKSVILPVRFQLEDSED